MKLIIQRVSKASVSVDNKTVSEIGNGLFILVGVGVDDAEESARSLASKVSKLRVMKDDNGKMNLTVKDAGGEFLVVSQFTLYADTTGGNRPSFVRAAPPETARPLYEKFVEHLKNLGEVPVKTGSFGEYMEISLELDGPVTILI